MTSSDLEQRMLAFQRCVEERDAKAAEDLLDDKFALVLAHPARAVMPRQRWLDVLPDYIVHSYEVEELSVDVDGDCATVLQRAGMNATVLGQDRSGVFVISDVWRRRGGRWLLWRRHSTPISAGELPGAN
ncbi:MAG: nuclear transport factor 2 family protein [Actinobacteria bacterium]|nr:nuclear transport factor 2 family protein [Actinomycetota bacterium]